VIHYWSYILAPFGLVGMWLSGKKNRNGWLLGLLTQTLWLAYSIQTEQYGFIVGTVAYGAVYLKNYLNWGKK
jgi:cell division protein FtsX